MKPDFCNGLKFGRQAGFTLIELVLVILIISALIGLSTPLFRDSISELALKQSSYNISKLMNYGQEKAIIDRKNFRINFDFSNSRYWLMELDNSKDPPEYKMVEGRSGRAFSLPQGISFEGPKTEIVFYPDGHSDEGSVDIFNVTGQGYRIAMKGFAGRTEIIKLKR